MDHCTFGCFRRCCLLLLVVTVSQVAIGQLPIIAVVRVPHLPAVGLNLTLMCNVMTTARTPTVTLRWKRDHTAIEEATFQHQSAKLALIFSPLTVSDLGTYACETFIQSEASYASASSVLSLDANTVNITGSTPAPKSEVIINAPPTPPVEGHPYTLVCSVGYHVSNITPHIEWVGPDGQILNSSDKIIVGPVAMATTAVSLPITFTSPSVLNSGTYTCRVNDGAVTLIKIALDVQGLLTGLTIKVQTKQAVLNMPYRADCIATVPSVWSATTTLLWIFPDGSHLGKMSTSGTTSLPLVISSLQTSNIGKYVCTMMVTSPTRSVPISITKEMVISQDARNNDFPTRSPYSIRNDSMDIEKGNYSMDSGLAPKRNYSMDSGLSPKGNYSMDSGLSPKGNYSMDSGPSQEGNNLVDSGPSTKGNDSMDNNPIPARNGILNNIPTTSKPNTKIKSPIVSKPNTKVNDPPVPLSRNDPPVPLSRNDPPVPLSRNDPPVPLSRKGIRNLLKTQSSTSQAVPKADKQNACSNTPPRPPGRPGPLGQPEDTPLTPGFSNIPPKTTARDQTMCSTIGTGPLSGPRPVGNLQGRGPSDTLLTGKGRQRKKTLRRRSQFVAQSRNRSTSKS